MRVDPRLLVVNVTDSAAGMRKALPVMAKLTTKLMKNEEIGLPEEEGYISKARDLLFSDKRGSQRAVEMLLARLNSQPLKQNYQCQYLIR